MHFNVSPLRSWFFREHMSLIPCSVEDLEYVAVGKSGIVRAVDEKRVLKLYDEAEEGFVERRAYERLGSHPNIARYLGVTKDGSIILERGEVLRKVCKDDTEIPFKRKLGWLRQAAEGLRHIHENRIVQADVSCNNMILTRGDRLKFIDFEGCSIDGEEPTSCYEWFSYRYSTPRISIQTDIFAFGCVIYELITGKRPYQDLEKLENRIRLAQQLYEQNQFPDVANWPLSEVMKACWHGTFNSMDEVIQALEAVKPV